MSLLTEYFSLNLKVYSSKKNSYTLILVCILNIITRIRVQYLFVY